MKQGQTAQRSVINKINLGNGGKTNGQKKIRKIDKYIDNQTNK